MLRLGSLLLKTSIRSCLSDKVFLNAVKEKNLIVASTQIVRNASFLNTSSADLLWKGVISVSNAGKRRGRGRGTDRKRKLNLNEGQHIGVGKQKMVWPGLTSPVFSDNSIVRVKKLDSVKEEDKQKSEGKGKLQKAKYTKLHPLERGWSGKQLGGRKLGPPDPIEGKTFPDFESVILECNPVLKMTALFGKRRFITSVVLTGNGNGLIGYGKSKSTDMRGSLSEAKNKAIKRLVSIDLIDKHTVNHDFFAQFGKTKIFVFKRPKGSGLICHRVIKECCKLIGITDLYAKVEGPMNYKHIAKGFILALLKQKTYQNISDETKLHLVEFSEEKKNYPIVLASPDQCLSEAEAKKNNVDFNEYIMGNRRILEREKKGLFYTRLPSWETHLKRTLYRRNEDKVKLEMLTRHGELRSYLADHYPECVRKITGITKD